LHYWRFGYVMPSRAIVFYSFLFYGFSAIFLVSLPLPTVTPNFCDVHTLARQVRLVPLQFVPDIVQANQVTLRNLNLISILESPVFLQVFFNFLLLMPLGFYLRYYFRVNRWWVAFAIALGATLTFELSQITGLFSLYPCPYRTFEVDDLLLNTAGAMVGYHVTPFFSNYLPDLQRRHTRPTTVSLFRRWVAFTLDWFLANSMSRLLAVLFFGAGPGHPLWLDFTVYALWFVGVPWRWQGQTVGKAIVNIQIVRLNGNPVTAKQLHIRYGVLIALPVLTDFAYNTWTNRQLTNQGYIGGWLTITLLGLLLLETLVLVGPIDLLHK
jgi:glycopeptide antibiotics resistance protein